MARPPSVKEQQRAWRWQPRSERTLSARQRAEALHDRLRQAGVREQDLIATITECMRRIAELQHAIDAAAQEERWLKTRIASLERRLGLDDPRGTPSTVRTSSTARFAGLEPVE